MLFLFQVYDYTPIDPNVPWELIISAVVFLFIGIAGWLATRRMKRKLREGLGREVRDEEVTSISAWMKADDRVVDSVIHDDSRQAAVVKAMEDQFTDTHD